MIWAFLPVVVLLGLIGWFAYREQGRRYEQILSILTTQRDEARQEAKVFRNLLFPVMARAEGAAVETVAVPGEGRKSSKAAASSPSAAPQPQPKTVDEIWSMRIPYRQKFRLLMQLTNSKKVRTDALASALVKQKPAQEKENVRIEA